jgi:Mrp family chromosome partitioning ATPase
VPDTAAAAIVSSLLADDGMGSLVERLLRVVPHAWAHLATRVEEAHREGAEVIAITGARRGEGRTTVVECLKQTLVALGRRVECLDSAPLEPASRGRDGGSIVLAHPQEHLVVDEIAGEQRLDRRGP